MELIPLVALYKLVPDVGTFERNLSFDIKAFKSRVNLYNLFLPVNNSITAIKITDYELLLVSAKL
jgi:hypothetical protein